MGKQKPLPPRAKRMTRAGRLTSARSWLLTARAVRGRAISETRNAKQKADANQHWHPYTDPLAAYLAGDFEALHEFVQRQAAMDDE